MLLMGALGRARSGYSGIRIYSGIYSVYCANARNERTLNLFAISNKQAYIINGNIPAALRCVTFFSQTSQDLSTINNFVDVLSHEQCEGRHVKGTDRINFRGFRPS